MRTCLVDVVGGMICLSVDKDEERTGGVITTVSVKDILGVVPSAVVLSVLVPSGGVVAALGLYPGIVAFGRILIDEVSMSTSGRDKFGASVWSFVFVKDNWGEMPLLSKNLTLRLWLTFWVVGFHSLNPLEVSLGPK